MSTAQHPPAYDTDVIVVGAGPVGLTTGCALRHHGINCLVLEERTGTMAYSPANNLWTRSQELLASIGIRDALAEQSYSIRMINTLINGVPTAPLQIDQVASPNPQVLHSEQDVIEKTLIEMFEKRGGTLDRGCKVVDTSADEAGVTVTFKRDCNALEEQRRGRYLVAADGAKSTIRPLVGLDFVPERFENWINRQMDVRLSWRRSTEPNQLWFFYYEQSFCGVLPVWGGYHRLLFLQDDAGVLDRDPTL